MAYEKLHESNQLIALSRRLRSGAERGEALPNYEAVRFIR